MFIPWYFSFPPYFKMVKNFEVPVCFPVQRSRLSLGSTLQGKNRGLTIIEKGGKMRKKAEFIFFKSVPLLTSSCSCCKKSCLYAVKYSNRACQDQSNVGIHRSFV